MVYHKEKFQRITQEQEEWIIKNFFKHSFAGMYRDTKVFFSLDKFHRKYELVFKFKKTDDKTFLAIFKYFTKEDGYIATREVQRPKKLIEELMRHYPPHTDIFERETIIANAGKLEDELATKGDKKQKPLKI